MKHPHAGGRYYRDKDGTLTRAGDDGEMPKATAKTAKPAPAGNAQDGDKVKDKSNG